jgi:hypothetical protein
MYVVQIGMRRIDGNIILDGFGDAPFQPVLIAYTLKAFEDKWMMCDHKIKTFLNRLIYDLFRHIQSDCGSFEFDRSITDDESRIIV